MLSTNESPTTSSYIPRTGAAPPGPPQPACNSGRGGTTPRPVSPPHPRLPRAGSTMDQARGPATHARLTAGLMTTRMLSNNRPEYYHPRKASRGTCTAGTGAHLLRESYTPGTPGGYGTYNLREWYDGHAPRRKLTKSLSGRWGCNAARYSCPPKPHPGHAGGHRLATQGPRRPPTSRHGYVMPSPAHHVGQNVPAPQHKANRPNHPNHQTQHHDTGTPPT